MLDIITEFFQNIGIMLLNFPPVVVIPIVIIILIVKKSRNKYKLKKRCLLGFFSFTAMSLLSEIILYTDTINFIESLADIMGGFFFVLFYYAVQAMCFTAGVTLLVTYIVLTIREKRYECEEFQNKF